MLEQSLETWVSLRVSRAGLELRHLQEQKRGVLNTEDSPHPWVVGVEMELGGQGASAEIGRAHV